MPEPAERAPRTVDIQGIMDLLPHRYPILLVDRILDYEPGAWIRGVKNITITALSAAPAGARCSAPPSCRCGCGDR